MPNIKIPHVIPQPQIANAEYRSKSEVINDLIRLARCQQLEIEHIRTELIHAEQGGFTDEKPEYLLNNIKREKQTLLNRLTFPKNQPVKVTKESFTEPVKETDPAQAEKALKKSMAQQLKEARSGYKNKTNNGDYIATALEELELDQIMVLADKLCEERPGFHATKYAHLNNGQKRMNCGNKIRKRATKLEIEALIADLPKRKQTYNQLT